MTHDICKGFKRIRDGVSLVTNTNLISLLSKKPIKLSARATSRTKVVPRNIISSLEDKDDFIFI